MYVYMYIYMYLYVYMYMYVCMYVCMYRQTDKQRGRTGGTGRPAKTCGFVPVCSHVASSQTVTAKSWPSDRAMASHVASSQTVVAW